MSVPGSANLMLFGGAQTYEIDQSLRFNSADSAYLNRIPGSAGNRKTYTISMWVKRGKLGTTARLFGSYSNANTFFEAAFDSNNNIYWYYYTYPGYSYQRVTSQVFRDCSAWMHLVFAFDSTNGTAADRMKIYANGQQITAFSATVNPSLNFDCFWNSTSNNVLGDMLYNNAPGNSFDGYMAEIHAIDGSALTPSSFGETDTITGAWIPKRYAGSYGTNGFYLKFADNSGTTSTTLGKDSSGNGNNWTPNNFSVTAGAGNDVLSDTPTTNWCTLNPLDAAANNGIADGNLKCGTTTAANTTSIRATQAVSSGKWYFEVQKITTGTINIQCGWAATNLAHTFDTGDTGVYNKTISGTTVMIAADFDNNAIWTGVDGTWDNSATTAEIEVGTTTNAAYTSVANYPLAPMFLDQAGSFSGEANFNFGQRAFEYTPPTGFKALNTANLPEPTIKDGGKYFNTVLWTGTSAENPISTVGFQPDFAWIKGRNNTTNHVLVDAVRGATKVLETDSTAVEYTDAQSVKSFDTNGFTLGTSNDVNNSTAGYNQYVGWNWKAGGTGSTNTAGTITSTVSANASTGFSVVTYTGTGSAATVGHGLGVAPSMIIVKNRNYAGGWAVYHSKLTSAAYYLLLNSTAAQASTSNMWNSTAPTSTVFSLGDDAFNNRSSDPHVAYCFSEVAGYSKFGSYTGNGSTDGPFVYCGFRPAWVMIKASSTGGPYYDWVLYDSARMQYNTCKNPLAANLSNNESYFVNNYEVDLLSNGFKPRNTSGNSTNTNGVSYIFAAFAELPFKYANAR